MSASSARHLDGFAETFRHEAFLYAGQDEFVDGAVSFIRGGLEAGEAILVVVTASKIGLLRGQLGGDRDEVCFADMAEVGSNPARIIPVWRDFVTESAVKGRPARGIGEPVWAERSPAELVECERHESLLNLAFGGSPAWWLLCPYDTKTLAPSVIEEAFNSHPFIMTSGVRRQSTRFRGNDEAATPFAEPLPDPPVAPYEIPFDAGHVPAVRGFVTKQAVEAGLGGTRASDFALAVHELATNSIRYGGGQGVLRLWRLPDAIICEVRDNGRIEHPLAGRELPTPDQDGGRGLWLVNQLCDLVQVRVLPEGNVVRVHMRRH